MRPAENIKRLIGKLHDATSAEMDQKVIKDALQALGESKEITATHTEPNTWRIIMKSRMTKLAAAAIITVAVLFGIGRFFESGVTFAQVIQPILNSRTVVFDLIMGKDETGPIVHQIVVGSRIRNTLSNMDTIMILDLDNAKMLTLDPKTKGAVYMDIQGRIQEGSKNVLGLVRNIVSKLQNDPNMPVQKLGQKEIDGRKAIGFLVRGPNEEITIWANPTTAKPVRIELLWGQLSAIIRNIEFDVPVDESLVSMEPPEGYKLAGMEYNLNQFTEQDFVESLHIWAELLRDGSFPETLSAEDYMKTVPLLGEKIPQSKLSKEQGTHIGMTFGRGMMFFQVIGGSNCDLHYAGKGVKLGDADKAIFWYKPNDSQTYRVIYGDLSVKDVFPQDLPK